MKNQIKNSVLIKVNIVGGEEIEAYLLDIIVVTKTPYALVAFRDDEATKADDWIEFKLVPLKQITMHGNFFHDIRNEET